VKDNGAMTSLIVGEKVWREVIDGTADVFARDRTAILEIVAGGTRVIY